MIMRRMTLRRLTSFLAPLIVLSLSQARGQESPSQPAIYTYKTIQKAATLTSKACSAPARKRATSHRMSMFKAAWRRRLSSPELTTR